MRRQRRGLLLLTAHRAQGLEFDQAVVLDGGWNRVGRAEDADAPRRLYYVTMTRSRQTLTSDRLPGTNPFPAALRDVPAVLQRDAPIDVPPTLLETFRRYRRPSLRNVFLGFAGYQDPGHPVHQAMATLNPGDRLEVGLDADRRDFLDANRMMVGQLARGFSVPPGTAQAHAHVLAVVSWDRERWSPSTGGALRNEAWTVVVPELVFEESS